MKLRHPLQSARHLLLLVVMGLISGCSQTDEVIGPKAEEFAQAVENLGFSSLGMFEAGEFIIVEGDIALSKTQLRMVTSKVRSGDQPSFQLHVDTLVGANRVASIQVDLTQIASNTAWLTATRAAMAHWNAMPGTRITFTESSPGDITVTLYSGDPREYAWASWPTAGGPGPKIWINQNAVASQESAIRVMAHELGHTLGLRHTDAVQRGEQPVATEVNPDGNSFQTRGLNLVAGTPTTDAQSVMNGTIPSNLTNWGGFSYYDKVAAMMLYNGMTFHETNLSGHPYLTYSFPRGALSLELTLQVEVTEMDDTYTYRTWSPPPQFLSSDLGSTSYHDVQYSWGYAYCSNFYDWPYPSEETFYVLKVSYPQGTLRYAVPARIQQPLNQDWSCN